MAKKSKTTFQKMEKEKNRQQKQRDKESRRVQARATKADSEPRSMDEDPDIAGIKPGPQPLPEQWDYVKEK